LLQIQLQHTYCEHTIALSAVAFVLFGEALWCKESKERKLPSKQTISFIYLIPLPNNDYIVLWK